MTFTRSVLPWRFLLPLLLWFAPRAVLAEPLPPLRSETGVFLEGRSEEVLLRRWHSPRRSHSRRFRVSDPPTRLQRILIEVSFGLSGGLAGAGLGYFGLTAALPCASAEAPCRDVVLGPAALAGLGLALGVYGGGQLLQGDGDFFLGALLGTALGGLGGALLSLPIGGDSALFLCPPLMLLGAITGYELTARGPAPQVQPVVGFSSQGARVGVMGTF